MRLPRFLFRFVCHVVLVRIFGLELIKELHLKVQISRLGGCTFVASWLNVGTVRQASSHWLWDAMASP